MEGWGGFTQVYPSSIHGLLYQMYCVFNHIFVCLLIQGQSTWKEIEGAATLCYLASVSYRPIDKHSDLYLQGDLTNRLFVKYLHKMGCYRLSQVGELTLRSVCFGWRWWWCQWFCFQESSSSCIDLATRSALIELACCQFSWDDHCFLHVLGTQGSHNPQQWFLIIMVVEGRRVTHSP